MLFRKTFRTIRLYLAQFISMIVMTAIGIGVFVGFNMEWYSIERNTNKFFDETGFADYRVFDEIGFSSDDLEKIKNIDGVDDATRFLSVNTTVKGTEKVLALAVSENIDVSGFVLIGDGEEYNADSEDGIWLSKQYADKNNIKLGDTITVVYKEIEISGKVLGLIKSGEFLICLPDETQLMPDFNTYGFAYISPKMLKRILGFEYYPQINISSNLDKKKMSEKIDNVFEKTMVILSNDENVSYVQTQGEIEEGKTMASVLPVLFLAIAILTMVTTMHRLAINEKTQIGILKALGFKDKKIIAHYTSFSILIGVFGTLFGIIIGYLMGYLIMNPNGTLGIYFDMPEWKLYVPFFTWIILILINALLIVIGYLSVKSMLKGSASDALRPYTPKKMKAMAIEKTKLWSKLNFGVKWNMRDIMRHKARSFMTLFGILGCTILIIASLGMKDTMNDFVDIFYEGAINYETRINISETATNEETKELASKYEGDYAGSTTVKINDQTIGLEIYNITHNRVKFIDRNMKFFELGDNGVYVCERIAKKLNIKVGDKLVFLPYGTNKSYEIIVEDIIRTLSETIIMSEKYAEKIGYDYHINLVFTNQKNIEANKNIVNTQSKSSIIKSFDTFMGLMNLMVLLLIVAALVLGAIVLYNLGVMSFMERYREMSTLKVVGFKDSKIGSLLISQNLWLTIVGIIIGVPTGVFLLKYMIEKLASEYEMKPTVNILTYILTIWLIILLSFVISLFISKKSKKIDMVESLKGID